MKTVGSILKKARQAQGLEHKKIYTDTKIPPRFLEALEEGDWSAFSSPVHAKGFLKNYSEYLGLKTGDILAFWRREYQGSRLEQHLKNNVRPLNAPRLVVTPGIVLALVSTVSVLIFFGYLFYQYYAFAGAPVLIVDQPKTDFTTSTTVLNVVGRTDRDAEVFINGQKISVGEKGTFSAQLTLAEGANTINIQSQNKLGRKNQVVRTVVVEAQKEVVATDSAKPKQLDGLEVKITIGPGSSWLEILADGVGIFEGLVSSGVEKVFNAEDSLTLKTGNAGSTKVTINGQEQDSIGKEGEVVEREYNLDTR